MPLGTPQQVLALRQQLWDAGFRPVPIYSPDAAHEAAGKAPRGADWGNLARQDPPAAAVSEPNADALNTGILCDGLRAIDIDIDNPTIAHSVRSRCLDMFGETAMRYRANSPRALLVYRAAEGTPAKRVLAGTFGKVEVLGRGQQFVGFGVHPSGADLQWMPEAPGEVDVASLRAVTEDEITKFLEACAPSIGALPPKPISAAAPRADRRLGADALQVVAALSGIPNEGPADWEAWNRIGMATWAATGGGEAGRAAFHAWSQQHPSYDAVETNERWDHYASSPPTQIGAGTLFYLARQSRQETDDAGEPEGLWDGFEPEEHAGEPVEEQRQEQPEAPPGTFPLQFFNDITVSLDSRDFVQGVLTEQSAAVVYGESNSGKTFWATDLALHVAAGLPWRGRRVEQGGVVYAVLEGGHGFRNRVAAWRAAHDGLEAPVHFAAVPHSMNLLQPDADVLVLIATIKAAAAAMAMPVKLIVIDTLSRALAGGDENSSEDMGALVKNMDKIRERTGACVLFVHHSGKDQARGARGWSGLRGAIDTEIEVKADDGSTRTAEVVKQRDLKKGDEFRFDLDVIEIGTNRHGEPVTTCLVKHSDDEAHASASLSRRRLPQQQQRALEVLADLVARAGQGGHAGTPAGIPSVPEKWWRDAFYERAMPGVEQEAKKRAYRRAADALVSYHLAGMSAGRVWVVRHMPDEGGNAA